MVRIRWKTFKPWNKQISLGHAPTSTKPFSGHQSRKCLLRNFVKGETHNVHNSFTATQSWHCLAFVWKVQIWPYVFSVYCCEMCPWASLRLLIKRLRMCYIYIALNIVTSRLLLALSSFSCVVFIVIASKSNKGSYNVKPNNLQRGCWLFISSSNVAMSIKEESGWVDTSGYSW